jgi:hypothetical protein
VKEIKLLINYFNPYMKSALLIAILVTVSFLSCKKERPLVDKVDFEELVLDNSGYWNGSDGSGGFSSRNIFFVNHYNTHDGTWSGFAYTNHKDTVTSDLTNLYSSVWGSGADNSDKYGVFCYSGTEDTLTFKLPEKITDMAICNTVYAYNTIRSGNELCKKFGGETGNDQDWYKLTITVIDKDGNVLNQKDVFLADYRFDDNSRDYILKSWISIDLSEFGYIKALSFRLTSSDIGPWGMNTPGYVCIDNIIGIIEE